MLKEERNIAVQAARSAGQIILGHYQTDYDVSYKSAEQPVTIADRQADEAIKKDILRVFPDDGWLSEETQDGPERLSKKRVWIVDPVDGTKEFINKIPEFAVSIALAQDGRVVVGVVYNPVTDELFSATLGGGAFFNEKRIHVSSQKNLKQGTLLISHSDVGTAAWKRFEGLFRAQPLGSTAYKMAKVACGFADGCFSLKPKHEWDFAAGHLLVEEAGGCVSELNGEKFIYNKPNPLSPGLLHANQALYPELLKLVRTRSE